MSHEPEANTRMPLISFDDFLKVDIRLDTIIDVKMFDIPHLKRARNLLELRRTYSR